MNSRTPVTFELDAPSGAPGFMGDVLDGFLTYGLLVGAAFGVSAVSIVLYLAFRHKVTRSIFAFTGSLGFLSLSVLVIIGFMANASYANAMEAYDVSSRNEIVSRAGWDDSSGCALKDKPGFAVECADAISTITPRGKTLDDITVVSDESQWTVSVSSGSVTIRRVVDEA